MLDPSRAFYLALFGALKAGAVAVPLFTLFGPDGLRPRLDDSGPQLLLLPPDKASLAQDLADADADLAVVLADDEFLDTLTGYPTSFDAATGPADMAMYQYTSGTTRELPEAVKHRHRAIVTVMIRAGID